MAISLLFKGSKRSGTCNVELELFANTHNELYVRIKDNETNHICLDREDAIKLSKELKKQINIMSINESL